MGPLDVFDWLAKEEWLAILRIGLGLWWLESVRHKDLPGFLRGGSRGWVEGLVEDHPIPAFAGVLKATALRSERTWVVTSWLVVLGEFAAGVSITFGFLTFGGLVLAAFLNLNYLLLAGLKDQGEQGQNLMMILIAVVLFATGAGPGLGRGRRHLLANAAGGPCPSRPRAPRSPGDFLRRLSHPPHGHLHRYRLRARGRAARAHGAGLRRL